MQRRTRQRDAIKNAISAAHGPLSAQEILAAAGKQVAGLGLATVYRTVKALADAGEIETVEVPGEPPRFEVAGRDHHHHFLCRVCEKLFEVHGCPGELGALTPRGFRLESHELLLRGVCKACLKR